jgi:hypothetical protein
MISGVLVQVRLFRQALASMRAMIQSAPQQILQVVRESVAKITAMQERRRLALSAKITEIWHSNCSHLETIEQRTKLCTQLQHDVKALQDRLHAELANAADLRGMPYRSTSMESAHTDCWTRCNRASPTSRRATGAAASNQCTLGTPGRAQGTTTAAAIGKPAPTPPIGGGAARDIRLVQPRVV